MWIFPVNLDELLYQNIYILFLLISGQAWSLYASFYFYDDYHLIEDSMYVLSVDVLRGMLEAGASFHDLQAETPFILGMCSSWSLV